MNGLNNARLGLESLERRENPAGAVTASLLGGQLSVYGDGADNNITVTQSATALTISGQNGTRVNGLASVTFAFPSVVQAEFKMEGGNDTVAISGLRTTLGDITLETMLGNDSVSMSNVQAGSTISVNMEGGDDSFAAIGATAGADMSVEMGDGTSAVGLVNVRVNGTLVVSTGSGNDGVSLSGVFVGGDLGIITEQGDDVVGISGARVNGSAGFSTDLGADWVSLFNFSTGYDLGIDTSGGNDRVDLATVGAGANLGVTADDGNDRVAVTNVNAIRDAYFIGGAGVDTFVNNGVAAGIFLDIKEFEII